MESYLMEINYCEDVDILEADERAEAIEERNKDREDFFYVLKDFEKCNADEVEIDIIDEHRAAITTKYTLIDFLENFISQCISDNSYISVEKYDN